MLCIVHRQECLCHDPRLGKRLRPQRAPNRILFSSCKHSAIPNPIDGNAEMGQEDNPSVPFDGGDCREHHYSNCDQQANRVSLNVWLP